MRIACSVGLAAAMAVGMMTQSVAAAGVGVATVKLCDARAHGAKADGVTKDTKAIQAAIDDCANAGGGTVRLIGGTFLTGPILLKSNITLEIEKGAVLLGSPDRAEYPMVTFAPQPDGAAAGERGEREERRHRRRGHHRRQRQGLVGLYHRREGSGRAGQRPSAANGRGLRPHETCADGGRDGAELGFWQIVPYYADDVTIRKIRVLAPKSPNTDAIDPFSSSNVVIDHVFASTGDDNVAIKSGAINSPGPDAPSRNITITDCTFENGHGISIGSEIAGGVQNVRVERVSFKGTDQEFASSRRATAATMCRISRTGHHDGGCEDRDPDYRVLPAPCAEGEVPAEPVGRLTPKFHDISIENVTATGSGSAGTIVGLPESPVLGLTMKNVHIAAKTGMSIAYATVAMDDVVVTPVTGDAMKIAPTAKVTVKK